jgi:putative acetyltransferase
VDFGFIPASRQAIRCEYDGVPDEAFMILVLRQEGLAGLSGVARYRPEFAEGL